MSQSEDKVIINFIKDLLQWNLYSFGYKIYNIFLQSRKTDYKTMYYLESFSFFQATLWSKIFKQELEMGHNEEAYNAMLSNPDSTRYARVTLCPH